MKHSKISKNKKKIIAIGKKLLEKNLIAGTWGNISLFLPKKKVLLITPSGSNYQKLKCSDILILDLNGKKIGKGKKEPSSELALHLAIYHKRKDILAIIHTHSPYALACAVTNTCIPLITEELAMIVGGDVTVAEYALAGTEKLALNVVQELKEKRAVLMANHGLVGCGKTLKEAMTVCELVENNAKILLNATALGEICMLDAHSVKILKEKYNAVYGKFQQ